jgi:NADH dehydrogenase
VRFAHGRGQQPHAVEAAARAGVKRIVHVSITNPSPDSPFPYFRSKAQVEQILTALGVSHAIVRPAILFDGVGVLINGANHARVASANSSTSIRFGHPSKKRPSRCPG